MLCFLHAPHFVTLHFSLYNIMYVVWCSAVWFHFPTTRDSHLERSFFTVSRSSKFDMLKLPSRLSCWTAVTYHVCDACQLIPSYRLQFQASFRAGFLSSFWNYFKIIILVTKCYSKSRPDNTKWHWFRLSKTGNFKKSQIFISGALFNTCWTVRLEWYFIYVYYRECWQSLISLSGN